MTDMMVPAEATCETCRFFQDGPAEGFCHRYAPKPRHRQDGVYWPEVCSEDWCGEWQHFVAHKPRTVGYKPG